MDARLFKLKQDVKLKNNTDPVSLRITVLDLNHGFTKVSLDGSEIIESNQDDFTVVLGTGIQGKDVITLTSVDNVNPNSDQFQTLYQFSQAGSLIGSYKLPDPEGTFQANEDLVIHAAKFTLK